MKSVSVVVLVCLGVLTVGVSAQAQGQSPSVLWHTDRRRDDSSFSGWRSGNACGRAQRGTVGFAH
jgi:hypothetical protein